MKKQLLVAVAAGLIGTSAMAQSAFEGFYGQIATGYESNSVNSLNGTGVDNPKDNSDTNFSASNQKFGGAPLVFGLGYNFAVTPQWLIGVGADYSAISQTSSSFNYALTNASGNSGIPSGYTASANGSSVQLSNRFNIFVTPGYAIDKDKLVYLKAGYSSISAKFNYPTTDVISGPAGTFTSADKGGSQSQTYSGYVIGLGYKQMISDGFYGFAEGNYMGYGSQTISRTTTWSGGGGTSTTTSSPTINSYQFLVGVGYKF